MPIQLLEKAQEFSLKATDNKQYTLASFKDKPILVVIFSCNHCPYVLAWEDRMIEIQKKYAERGVQLVAINANEDKNYPEDSFDNMAKHAKSKGFNFVYLRDETQEVAKAYGATRTPDVFVFDKERVLRYHGAIDDNWEKPQQVNKKYLTDVIEALLKNQEPPYKETLPVGCTIKWKK